MKLVLTNINLKVSKRRQYELKSIIPMIEGIIRHDINNRQDVHAEYDTLNNRLNQIANNHNDIVAIFQAGDLGEGFTKDSIFVPDSNVLHRLPFPIIAIDGNHENFDRLELNNGWNSPYLRYLPRGEVIEVNGLRILGMGGATSIDKRHRKAHIDWWPQENITYAQVDKALENAKNGIDIVLTHDRPDCFPVPKDFNKLNDGKPERMALEAIYDIAKPKLWCHGHYHDQFIGQYEDTTVVCCPIIDNREYFVFDLITDETYFRN